MFFLTRAGRNAMLGNATIKAEFANASFGTGRYVSQNNSHRTTLQTPIITSPITTKLVENGRMQLVANIRTNLSVAIYEVGLFDKSGVLLAIKSSQEQPLFHTTPNINQVVTINVTI